jgi:hypothetical protein
MLERAFTLAKFHGVSPDVQAARSVGVLARLSVDRALWDRLDRVCTQTIPRSPEGEVIYDLLFGTRQDAAHRIVPGYDTMGMFPAFKDQFGREYFIQTMPLADYDRKEVWSVRIPRRDTAKQHRGGVEATQLPQPGKILEFTPCGLPIFPFVWNSWKRDVQSIALDEAALDTRLGTVLRLVGADLFLRKVSARVTEVIGEKEASCAVKLQLYETDLVEAIDEVRRDYSLTVVEFLEDIIKTRLEWRITVNLLNYIQRDWAHRAVAWTRAIRRHA